MSIIHESWKYLEPTKSEQRGSENALNEYIERITCKSRFNNMPRDWFWFICKNYHDKHISKCCSWINFYTINFSIEEWTYHDLMSVNFIGDANKNFKDYINEIEIWPENKITDRYFTSCARHINFWTKNGTWETPPFIIKLNTEIKSQLPISNNNSMFLLIEGYTRFGILNRFFRNNKIKLNEKHKFYLLS